MCLERLVEVWVMLPLASLLHDQDSAESALPPLILSNEAPLLAFIRCPSVLPSFAVPANQTV